MLLHSCWQHLLIIIYRGATLSLILSFIWKSRELFKFLCRDLWSPLPYWHEAGNAWGWQYSLYSDTMYLSELFVLRAWLGCAHHSPGLSRCEAVTGWTLWCRPVQAESESSQGLVEVGSEQYQTFKEWFWAADVFIVTLKMTNNAAVRRWVSRVTTEDWIGQSIPTIYFVFKMITNCEFLHWTFWFSTMYFSNFNQI